MTSSLNRPNVVPEVSVIVPAYNAAATVGACVRSLCNQTTAKPYEIIVVDDGSDDATAAVARQAGAYVLSIQRSRPAAARNAGITAAAGTIICCTDADCEPTTDWLEQITLPLANPRIAAAKGTYATYQRSLVARFVQLEYEDKYDHMAQSATINFIDTYSAAYRKSVLLENGGFDDRFHYLEDQELSFRLAAQGQTMVFQPAAVVYHQHADSLWAYLRKKVTIGYWKTQVVRRFPERAVHDSHTPQVMKGQMLLTALLLTGLAGMLLAQLVGSTAGVSAGTTLTAVSALLFLASTLPFCLKAWSKDRLVAVVAPFLLLVRAAGLGVGTMRGLLRPPDNQSKLQPATTSEPIDRPS